MNRVKTWSSTRSLWPRSVWLWSLPSTSCPPPWSACIRASRKVWPALAPAAYRTGAPSSSSPTAPGVLARWLLPNLAAILAVASLAYSLFVFNGGEQFFRDSDSGWHIRSGESILAHRVLPSTDPYSFSKAGQPWIAWEWGSDVLLGLAHRIDGLRGVALLIALAISACIWLYCRLQFAVGGDFF